MKFTNRQQQQLDQAIRLLRDRHYRNYHNAKDQSSPTAQEQYRIYQELDGLRAIVRGA